jgi:hypothetical protein
MGDSKRERERENKTNLPSIFLEEEGRERGEREERENK